MNRGYVINDDIAIVSNEIGEQDIREATLNIKEVLIKAKEIAILEKERISINSKINHCQKKIETKKQDIKNGVLLTSGVIYGKLSVFLWGLDLSSSSHLTLTIGALISSVIWGGYLLQAILAYKKEIKKLDSNEFQRVFIEECLSSKKKEIQELYKNNKINSINLERENFEVDDRKELEELRKYLETLKEYGDNISFYAKIYYYGVWEDNNQEITRDGLNPELLNNYFEQYNIRKLEKKKWWKKVS